MTTTTIDGVQLFFERHGDRGDPLVLVHGATGDISDWRYQIAEFAPTHQILAMDLRGHGRSGAPTDRAAYTIDRMSRDVEALIDHAGFERYHVVGHSMGGAIVQEIALRSPSRLASLTLHDTGFAHPRVPNERLERYNAERRRIADEEGMPALAARPSPLARPPFLTDERQREETERLARMSADAFIGIGLGIAAWPGTRDRIDSISVPTLAICGELDVTFLRAARRIGERVAGATVAIIPQAGHAPQYERPDLFNAALGAHLKRNALDEPA